MSQPKVRTTHSMRTLTSVCILALATPGTVHAVNTLGQIVARLPAKQAPSESPGAEESDASAPTSSANQGFVIRATDQTSVRVRGLLHYDGRHYPGHDGTDSINGWTLRRARPILQVHLTEALQAGFTTEFAGRSATILDAFLILRVTPWMNVTAGKFKVPIGLERIAAATDLRFSERALPTSLAPNRDLGMQVHGELKQNRLSYSLGYFNGVGDGGSSESNGPTDTSGDWAGRVFALPFLHSEQRLLEDLGVGVAATYGEGFGGALLSELPVYRTSGQQIFFAYREGAFADGRRMRLTAHMYYHYGPFGMLAETIESSQRVSRPSGAELPASLDIRNAAWQLQVAWFITGEQQSFRGPVAVASSRSRAWGAFEVVARYHELEIDDAAFSGGVDSLADRDVAASAARAFAVGLNWYANQYLKCSLSYELTRFSDGAIGGDRADERFLSSRFAVSF